MEEYSSISHLVRSFRVEPERVDIEFCSDCGELRQVVSLPIDPGQETSSREPAMIGWFRSVVKTVLGRKSDDSDLSGEKKAELTCRAFEQIRPRLQLSGGKWIRAQKDQHPGEFFDQQLRANPIVEKYDIEVLVRVLVEVSRSDSELRTEERAFLEEIVHDEATIKRLSKAPRITVSELAEASSVPVKETILMLAWAMAYADGRLDTEEMNRLNQLCRGFMLPEKRVRELQMAAKLFLLDRHFQALKDQKVSLQTLKEEFDERAKRWGLDEQQLETLRSWYPNELKLSE